MDCPEPSQEGSQKLALKEVTPSSEIMLGAKSVLVGNVIGNSILSFGSQFFTEIESNWFNSYFFNYVLGGIDSNLIFVSIMVAMNALIGTIFFILWGIISDNLRTKYGRRRPIILIGFLGTSIMIIGYAFADTIWLVLLFGGVLIPVISNMIHMSGKIYAADLIPTDKRGRSNLLVVIFAAIASMLNWIPTIMLLPEGDGVYSLEIHRLFILIAAAVLFSTGIIIFLVTKEPILETPGRKIGEELLSILDFKQFRKNKEFFTLFIASLFVIMAQNAYMPFLLIMIQEIDMDAMQMVFAAVIVATAVGMIIGLATKYIDKLGRKKLVIPGLIISPFGGIIVILLGEGNFWGIILGFAIMFPFATVVSLCTDTMTQDLLPAEARGKFMGIIRLGTAIGKAVGALVTGILVGLYGNLWMFFASGLMLWIAIPFFLRVPETLTFKK